MITTDTTDTITPTALQSLQSAIRFACGGYTSPIAREEAIERKMEMAAAALAEGQWIIEDGTGVGLFNPVYHQNGFRPLRWMTAAGIATMQNLTTRIKVGDSFTREISFHPRHGITTRTARRLA